MKDGLEGVPLPVQVSHQHPLLQLFVAGQEEVLLAAVSMVSTLQALTPHDRSRGCKATAASEQPPPSGRSRGTCPKEPPTARGGRRRPEQSTGRRGKAGQRSYYGKKGSRSMERYAYPPAAGAGDEAPNSPPGRRSERWLGTPPRCLGRRKTLGKAGASGEPLANKHQQARGGRGRIGPAAGEDAPKSPPPPPPAAGAVLPNSPPPAGAALTEVPKRPPPATTHSSNCA